MKEVKTEIEQRTGDGLAIHQEMLFHQMPAARPHQQRRHLGIEVVALALGTDVADGALDRVAQIELAFEIVLPGGRIRILEIRHEDVGAGVQRIDDHLAVDRARDLDTAVEQVVRNGRDGPFGFADAGGFGEEVGQLAGVDLLLAGAAAGQKLAGGVLQTRGPVLVRKWLASGVRICVSTSLRRAVVVVVMSYILMGRATARPGLLVRIGRPGQCGPPRFVACGANAFYSSLSRHAGQDTASMHTLNAAEMTKYWHTDSRWKGTKRPYSSQQVEKLRGSFQVEHTLARLGAERLWWLLHHEDYVPALGALTGNQAVQQVQAGLKAIYLSGWQVAADANNSGQMYPDQSLYPADSVPNVVRRINNALLRADQIHHMDGKNGMHWMAPIVADAEAGFGGTPECLRTDEGDDRGRRRLRAF